MKKIVKEICCIARYDLKIFFRYKSNLIWLVATPLIFSFVGMILLNIMGPERFEATSGGATSGALYTLIGYGVFSFANYCWQAGQKIENEMVVGTMKTNFLLPINRLSYVYGLCISTLCSTGLFSVLILIISVLIARPDYASLGKIMVAFVLAISYFLGVAVVMTSVSLRYKKIGGMANLLTFVLQLITGMMIPVQSLPDYIKIICYLSPTTWAIDSIRGSILNINSMLPIGYELIILFISAVASNLLGRKLFCTAEDELIENGEIEGY